MGIKKLIKVVIMVLILNIMVGCLVSCVEFPYRYNLEYDSLDEYKSQVEERGNGFFHFDDAEVFLPTQTFLSDFKYINGSYNSSSELVYNWVFIDKKSAQPSKVLLSLEYTKEEYEKAKAHTFEKIPRCGEDYVYNDYIFYQNSNFMESKEDAKFPCNFTMVCYNDKNNTLIFIGFTYKYFSEEEQANIKSNWQGFIDKYYAEYYNFSR
ncbi:MAG: hypothetical protein IJD89_02390 [Clostridia bacterium]|nr:hypothetical protein [Clostridia bacterium]